MASACRCSDARTRCGANSGAGSCSGGTNCLRGLQHRDRCKQAPRKDLIPNAGNVLACFGLAFWPCEAMFRDTNPRRAPATFDGSFAEGTISMHSWHVLVAMCSHSRCLVRAPMPGAVSTYSAGLVRHRAPTWLCATTGSSDCPRKEKRA